MKLTFLFFPLLLFSITSTAQSSFLSVKGGVTYASINSIIEEDGQKISDYEREGSGKLAYTIGVEYTLPVFNRVSFCPSLMYERIAFESYSGTFKESHLNHFKLGLHARINPIKDIGVMLSLDVLHRDSYSKNSPIYDGPVNGLDVAKGLYLQAAVGIDYQFEKGQRIAFELALPKLSSVTRLLDPSSPPNTTRLFVEQMVYGNMTLSWPIWSKAKGFKV